MVALRIHNQVTTYNKSVRMERCQARNACPGARLQPPMGDDFGLRRRPLGQAPVHWRWGSDQGMNCPSAFRSGKAGSKMEQCGATGGASSATRNAAPRGGLSPCTTKRQDRVCVAASARLRRERRHPLGYLAGDPMALRPEAERAGDAFGCILPG